MHGTAYSSRVSISYNKQSLIWEETIATYGTIDICVWLRDTDPASVIAKNTANV